MTRFHPFLAATFLGAGSLAAGSLPLWAHQGHTKADPTAIIYNGDFADGTDRPDHWLLVPPREVVATGLLDTAVFKSGLTSLRLTVTGREDAAPTGDKASPL